MTGRVWRIAVVMALATLTACAGPPPDCPFDGEPHWAPSAGCFAVAGEGLLLVKELNGRINLPGGSSDRGEPAQCTAFRETWEETGLRLRPRELLLVFDTGYHLYRCELDAASGDINPPPRLEVRAAFFLPADRFDEYRWRFPEQQPLLLALLHDAIEGERQ